MRLVVRGFLWTVIAVLASFSLILGPMAVRTLSAAPQPKVHPAARAYARIHPRGTVPVIIQKASTDNAVENDVVKKGGRVKDDLPLIKGVAVEIPSDALDSLGSQPGVRWISYDAPVHVNAMPAIDTSALASVYPWAVGAPGVWNGATSYTGENVTVAVVDSGVNTTATSGGAKDYGPRVVASVSFFDKRTSTEDKFGHGTHVAGIIAGDGASLKPAKYIGVAPRANLVNVKVSDDTGTSTISSVVAGLQWIHDNRLTYNIRVANLSLSSGVAQSYLTDPIDAAVEQLWFDGVVVVVSAGNRGSVADAVSYAPANDPYVIVVGAVDDKGTWDVSDDAVTSWSSQGTTQDGISKPDVWAPGSHVVSTEFPGSVLAKIHPANVVDKYYLRMGGTSMATAVTSGVVALALQAHPSWTPDQVKWVLMNTGSPLRTTTARSEISATGIVGYAGSAISANVRNKPNLCIDPTTGNISYDSVTWDSVTWDSVTWDSVTWDSVTWD